jgi:hypothetical protein
MSAQPHSNNRWMLSSPARSSLEQEEAYNQHLACQKETTWAATHGIEGVGCQQFFY